MSVASPAAALSLACLATTGAEAAVAWAAFDAALPATTLLASQAALSAVLLAGCGLLYRGGARSPPGLLLLLGSAAMGPAGTVGAVLALLLHRLFARRATPFAAWHAALFPEVEVSPVRALYERIVLRGAGPDARGGVAPFADIMALGTVAQKQLAISVIADEFRPAFALPLRAALNDAEPAIRVQAATAMARIENRFLECAIALEERRSERPEDPLSLLALARHHDAYAHTGLLDAGRAASEWRQALELYERVAALRPTDAGLEQARGRLLLRLGRPAEALQRLAPLVRQGAAPPEVLAWYLECLYRLGDRGALRRAAAELAPQIEGSALPFEVREAVRLWAAPDAATKEPSTCA
ncbi:hypothetical protein QWZ14_11535 [Paeniroseomonas aquatica]|uniref:Tetratricopeptide repeat protein n=2 Tax=Paeniroseomonas aquatica TaxID=373043 RepID=A0ABT8A5G5_9PROT|nr:tetratricopeptide repeat protein [Paeniroseomonas aquatica]MDN3564992.1 hypothetical protein [Paeniroseomonas aquatica]